MQVAEKNGTLSWQGQNDVYKGFLWINLWEQNKWHPCSWESQNWS